MGFILTNTYTIVSTTKQKTTIAAVAVAICSLAAFAGDYNRSGTTVPAVIPGNTGENNTLIINGATIGSSATPSAGGGTGLPSLISVGGNNGVPPYDYGNITIDEATP